MQPEMQPMRAVVSIADQKMDVYVGDKRIAQWTVSTSSPLNTDCTEGGIPGGRPVVCETPIGTFHPTFVKERAFSKKWQSWMYYPVFFDWTGDAIHGTDEVAELGHPASHGCVRLLPENAKIFHDLVVERRRANAFPGVTITILPDATQERRIPLAAYRLQI
jgi:hypothetical protein